MADENVADNQTTDTPKVETPTISETELENLKAESATMKQLNEDAQALGYNSHTEYVAELERTRYNEIKDEGKKADVVDDKKEPEKPAPTPVATETPPPDPLAVHAVLEAQYAVYRQLQSELPKEQRSEYSRKDLLTVIQGPKGLTIQGLITDPEFDGNTFMAAKYLLDIPKSKKDALQQATETADALSDAKETAKVSTDAPPPDNKQEKSVLEKEADDIAPDDKYDYSG